MKHCFAAFVLFLATAAAVADGPKAEPKSAPESPKGPASWKVEVVVEQPKVNYCSVVACAPDGRVFLAEDPMDMIGPPNQPADRILCIHPDGKITVYAEKLYAVFGLLYMDGKLYVHHSPKFSVFDDAGDVGKNRVDLIDCTHPQPWAAINDHVPANFRLGMDGWFYMSVGDKGIYGALGKDRSKAEIHGGGILRFKPDGTKLEVFATGTRNHLDVALTAEDEIFTYDNTDDGLGWWTKFTHMVDGGFYGYPYDFKPRRPYTLWAMKDYGGGSPTGALAYNEDALPKEYHGNLFMGEWGRSELDRFIVERDGGSYKVVRRDAFLTRGTKEFRPIGVALSPDGMSIYIADWNFAGALSKTVKAGRLIKATFLGKSEAAPKPAWYLPAAMGQPFKASIGELVEGLSHPAQSVRLVAMRRVAERGKEAIAPLEAVLKDSKAPPVGRWSAIWTLSRLGAGRAAIVDVLSDTDPSVRRQAARALGDAKAADAVVPLITLLTDTNRSVGFQAATALGRIGDSSAIDNLLNILADTDLFVRHSAFTALNRIGRSNPTAWPKIAAGLASDKAAVREGSLFAFRETYECDAVDALASAAADPKIASESRGEALVLLGNLALQRPAWKGQWWGTQPSAYPPPKRSVEWAGTKAAFAALKVGLKDVDVLVRQAAAQGMIASNSPTLVTELVDFASSEQHIATRRVVVKALATVKNSDPAYANSVNRLVAQLFDTVTDPDLVGDTIVLAATLPSLSPDGLDGALKQLNAKLPPAIQAALLDALSKSNSNKALAAIVAKARGDEPGIVSHAIKLLTTMKGDEATIAIVDALKNTKSAVRKDAAIALGRRRDKSAIPALLEAMNDKDLCFDALNALAQMPDKRALELFVDGTTSKNQQQRDACLNALKPLKSEALPVIEKRLTQKPPIPAESIFALQRIYGNDPEARKSPLFTVAARSISLDDFLAASVKEPGDVERGRKIFLDMKGAACIRCHKLGNEGGDVGPDLRAIGTKYNRLQLAEAVLDPSKQILDGYHVTVIETKAGQLLQGIVKAESDGEVTLLDAESKKIIVKAADIESRTKSQKSIMPDGLHIGMTPSEFANLIRFLESLKESIVPPAKTSGLESGNWSSPQIEHSAGGRGIPEQSVGGFFRWLDHAAVPFDS